MDDFFDIRTLQKYYKGFYIHEPLGNNAFSFSKRKNKRIYVPPIIEGSADDLALGEKVAFSEIPDPANNAEINVQGLKEFVYLKYQGKDVFIFDNHNHAFFFWVYALKIGKLKFGETLVHVDQHRDTRAPAKHFVFPAVSEMDLQTAFQYANFELNVGNFIKPALQANIFKKLEVIDSREAFEKPVGEGCALDLDMDIFSKDMAYIPKEYKIERIKKYVSSASFITIATSPFFMDQVEAIRLIKVLFN